MRLKKILTIVMTVAMVVSMIPFASVNVSAESNSIEDLQIFKNKYYDGTVYDVQRSPAYPEVGKEETFSGFKKGFCNKDTGGTVRTLKEGEYLQFKCIECNKEDSNALEYDTGTEKKYYSISVYLYNNEGNELIASSVTFYGPSNDDGVIFCEFDNHYGVLFTNKTYSYSDKLTYTPAIGKVTKISELEDYDVPVYEHIFSKDWTYDDEYHWHACTIASDEKSCIDETGAAKAQHTGGTATCLTKKECTVCGAEYGDYAAHVLKYEANGNSIVATCDNENCDDSAQITLTSKNAVYTGNPQDAAAFQNNTQTDKWKKAIGDLPAIKYYSAPSEGATTGGTYLGDGVKPSEIGYYYAEATVEKATAVVAFNIDKTPQEKPEPSATNESIKGKADGSLTGLTDAMEYRKSSENEYTKVTTETVENLPAGEYKVRYAETDTKAASEDATITIKDGKGLTVTFDVQGGSKVDNITDIGWQETVTLPTTKKDNYVFKEWNTDKNGKGETLTDKTKIEKDVTYYAVWESQSYVVIIPSSNASSCSKDKYCVYAKYSDSDPAAWYHDGVHFCVYNKYMNGVSATAFAPNDTLSRAMIVTVLWRMDGSPATYNTLTFNDVTSNQWYTNAIRWAQYSGVVTGYTEKSFGPEDTVTREQLAAILYRYAAYKKADLSASADLSKFTDAKEISSYAETSLKWANAKGLINGRTATTIAPSGTATRAEAATMLYRLSEALK